MKKHSKLAIRSAISTAAVAAIVQINPAFAGTTAGFETISAAGSTALKNWLVKSSTTFTDIQPGQTMNVGGVQYPTTGVSEWEQNSGPAYAYQLAPKSASATLLEGSTTDQAPAVRFEFNESGSVEGVLEMANDQIAPVNYVTQNVNRDPNTGNGVWVNYQEFGGAGTTLNPSNWSSNATTTHVGTGSINGQVLGEYYAGGQQFTLGGTAQPAFNLSGGNLNGGENAVQFATSDAIPVQIFAADNTTTTSSTPWTLTPQNSGYGQGNRALTGAGLGTANLRAVFQSATALNMPAASINPRTGAAFGTGPWNKAELGNLNTQTVAVTATTFVANPGTGLTQVNRTDAQWLETTGRLQNGASFNMTTRDVNSGTRNVSALESGIDPTWAVGANDNGNGNALNGGSDQITIGAGLRFSNKESGGAELRPTVQDSRMAVGTLSINDASGHIKNATANPLRNLAYSDSTDGSASYVQASYATISSGTYTIFQNEQFTTVKAPDANYNNSGSAFGANSPDIQGDYTTGDVKSLLGNTIGSVATYLVDNATAASPAAGLMSQGYIIPQLMQVQKAQNGLNQAGLASQIVSNIGTGTSTQYNANLANGAAFSSLVTALSSDVPSAVTSGTGSQYGANTQNGQPFGSSPIAVTTANYLFGNFNQNGIRDFSAAIVSAQKAQSALDVSSAGTSGFTGSNTTVVTTGIATLDAMPSQNGAASSANTTGTGATKGDLIVMGDYNGDGVFDGRDLYDMAIGASLSDAANRPVLVGSGPTATIQAGTGTISASASNFGTAIASSVLNKNVALDYLNDIATTNEKQEARAVLSGVVVPAGATDLHTTDDASGLEQFTYDPTGSNAFNKSDVNGDGVVDFNDAFVVDSLNGKSFSSQSDSLNSTVPSPVTGTPELANLVLAQQIDTNSSIGASDLAVVSAALTGTGNTNWYAYAATKTGPGTISWARTGGTVTVYAGASLNISTGTVHVTSAIDPFTDSSITGTSNVTSSSLPITVASGATLEFTGASTTGVQINRLSSLMVAGSVKLDSPASQANRTLLITGGLTINGSGSVDLGSNEMIVEGGSLSAIVASLGAGITSSKSDPLSTIAVVNGGSAFDGVTTAASDVLMKDTYYGDANLDGAVDGSDYTKIDAGFNGSLTGWANGDFNYDGVIDGSDYTLIDNAFNSQAASYGSNPLALVATETSQFGGGGASSVPEPTTLGLLGIGAAGLLARRRRSAR